MSDPTEPPLLSDPCPRPTAANRVALGLFLFGFVELAEGVAEIAAFVRTGGGTLNLLTPFSFLAPWTAALLVWKDKRVIWPILSYLSALGLGGLFGTAAALGLLLPRKLVLALARCEPAWFWFAAGYFVAVTIFLIWLLWEIGRSRSAWSRNFRLPRSRWLQPGACGVLATLPCALFVWVVILLLQGPWTRPAVERARAECGTGYDYWSLRFQVVTHNGRTRHEAVVLAYSDSELKQIPLHWED
jgi:hypothetical protein